MKLTCPFLWAPVYGTCQQLSRETYFLGIRAEYTLYPVWEKTTFGVAIPATDKSIVEVGKAIRNKFNKETGLSALRCGKCGGKSITKTTEAKEIGDAELPLFFEFVSEYFTNDRCQAGQIIEGLSVLSGKEIIVKIGRGKYITFEVEIDSGLHVDSQLENVVLEDTKPLCPIPKFRDISEFTRCPAVLLNNDTYFKLTRKATNAAQRDAVNSLLGLDGNPNAQIVGPEFQENLSFSVNVCLDEYKNLVALLKGSASQSRIGQQKMIIFTSLILASMYHVISP